MFRLFRSLNRHKIIYAGFSLTFEEYDHEEIIVCSLRAYVFTAVRSFAFS